MELLTAQDNGPEATSTLAFLADMMVPPCSPGMGKIRPGTPTTAEPGRRLRAGVPPVMVPFFGDQLFWGHRLCALGVSPATLP